MESQVKSHKAQMDLMDLMDLLIPRCVDSIDATWFSMMQVNCLN